MALWSGRAGGRGGGPPVNSGFYWHWTGSGQLEAGIWLQFFRTVLRETLVLHYRAVGVWVQGDEGAVGH